MNNTTYNFNPMRTQITRESLHQVCCHVATKIFPTTFCQESWIIKQSGTNWQGRANLSGSWFLSTPSDHPTSAYPHFCWNLPTSADTSAALWNPTYADTNSLLVKSSDARGGLLAVTSKVYLQFRLLTKAHRWQDFKRCLQRVFGDSSEKRWDPRAAWWVTCADAVIPLCSRTLCKYTRTHLPSIP